MITPHSKGRACWCGNGVLVPYSEQYQLCPRCKTLVALGAPARQLTQVRDEESDLYGLNYFVARAKGLGHPDLFERAHLDLSERAVYWLKTLLRRRPPPARTLELGCANGAFVALCASAGYDATGLDLSPALTAHVQQIFAVPVITGPLEEQQLPSASVDVVVMMDVLEHLGDPLTTVAEIARVLKPDGLLLAQTPCFDPDLSYQDLQRRKAPFLVMMDQRDHLTLLSRASAAELMERVGLAHVAFEPAIFSDHDMFFVASRAPIPEIPEDVWRTSLRRSRPARVVEALVDAFDASRSYRPSVTDHAILEAELMTLASTWPEAEGVAATEGDVIGRTLQTLRRAAASERARSAQQQGPPRSPALEQLALLRQICQIDYEQVLAFQYAKLLTPGDLVVDVGAHTGLHSARFLHLVGDVGGLVLVEPQPGIVERFLRPVFGNRRNCEIFEGAVADAAGATEFVIATGAEQESGILEKSGYGRPLGGPVARIHVQLSTIDELVRGRRVAFVKIDTEGAELRVLAGARDTLARSRPVVAIETAADAIADYGGSPDDLFDLAKGEGYEVATLFGQRLSREDFRAASASGVVWDFFLVPTERQDGLLEQLRRTNSPYERDAFVDLRASSQPLVRGLVGFSGMESWGRWTDARLWPHAIVQLATPLPAAFTLEVVGMGIQHPESAFDLVVGDTARTLALPGDRLGTVVADFETTGGAEVIGVRPHAVVCPAEVQPGGDPRRLGVGIQSIRVLPRGA